jgi:hypothetical protein
MTKLSLAAENWQRSSDLAMKLLVGYRICPALFVIVNKSVNRNQNDQEAGM